MCTRFLVSVGMAVALSTGTLQAADTIVYANNASSNQFGTLNLNTGVFSKIATGVNTNGFGVSGGALYGMNGTDLLFQFNFSTGAITYAANYSLSNNLQGFGSTSAGLYLVDGYGNLIWVNPATGRPTLIGPTGVTGLGGGILSTSADSSTLYWVNNGPSGNALYRLNTSTGAATLVGATGNGAGSGVVQAMLFQGGTLWASLGYNTGATIGTLSTSNAAETFVANAPPGLINALAPYPLSAVPQPYTCTTQPSITSVNSASAYGGYGYFASGTWLEIKGSNLVNPADPRLAAATNPGQWTAADFSGVNAPTALDNISVTINGKPAYVWYLSPTQLNVQAPEDSATGTVAITVNNCTTSSLPFSIQRQALAPGLLAPPNYTANGTQYMVATFVSDGAYVLNTTTGASFGLNSRPAKPGDLIIAYGIGFGGVTPTIQPGVIVGQSNALANPVTVSFGSTKASLSYAGLAGSFVGLYEFYITVPLGLANGDYQINVAQNGVAVPQTMYLTVHN